MNKVINPDILRESFIETGMYNPVSRSYDLTKIMSKHKVTMSLDETLHFVESISKLAKIIGERGVLTEAALKRAGFPETTVKGNKTLIQQSTIKQPLLLTVILFKRKLKRKKPKMRQKCNHRRRSQKEENGFT